jgi:hypothetical protein
MLPCSAAKLIVEWLVGSRAPVSTNSPDVRSTPISDAIADIAAAPLSAKPGLMHRSKQHIYSITSSAVATSDGGTVRPSAFAVLKLITSSYLVGACTGRSAGFSPLSMRSA